MRIRAALATILLLACGCAGDHGGKIVLRVGTWGGAGEDNDYDRKIKAIYEEFGRENPGVEVRAENIPDYYVQKIILGTIAGTEPDIVILDASSSALFMNNDIVTDLMPLVRGDKEFKLTDFYDNVVGIARRGDKLYAIPQDFTPMVLYYNKKMFDRAGLPYPKPGWNFQDFLGTARRLTLPGAKEGDSPKQYGFYFTNWMAGWIMWLWNNGGDVVSPDGKRATGWFNSPRNAATIAFLRDLINKYHASPSISQAAAQGVDLFANGQAAMAISGHWSMVGYQNAPKGADGKPMITWDDLGVVELPHDTRQPNTVMYESGYGIGRNCKHRDLAWKFIKYMTSYKVQMDYNSKGIAVDARRDVAEERAKVPLEAEFLPIIPSCRPPYGTRIEGYEFLERAGQGAMDNVLQNGADPMQALTKAAARIDREFAKR